MSINSVLEDLGGITPLAPTVEAPPALVEPSNHYSPGVTSSVEDKALALLGAGVDPESTAAALGVTASRISQLLAEKSFADKVSELKYAALTEHNVRDNAYDKLEDKLLVKLDASLPLLIRPESILKAMSIVNGAKRRGHTTTNQISNSQTVVNLTLPTVIVNKFVTDINNQVIKAGNQELMTMASGNLLDQVEKAAEVALEVTHVQDSGGET
jgi:hypothetical protein